MKMTSMLGLTTLAVALSAASASASAQSTRTVSGSSGNLTWTATSLLTGTTNTQSGGPITNGGDPIYWASYPADLGVVHLVMDYGPTVGSFICSGSLLSDRRSILTAGHCVSEGASTANPITTTVYFQPAGGLPAGTRIQTGAVPAAGVVTRSVTNYFVNGAYTGDVIDQNDIAVLRLDADAPSWAVSYGLYTNSNLTGANFNVQGYGVLGDGATGNNNFAARQRSGDNRYDYALGNSVFGANWATVLGEPFSQIEHSWVSDFDSGAAANDTARLVAQAPNLAGAAGAAFADLGRGAREVGVAGGDSGGPGFINGQLSSVNSYGLTFGVGFGDSLAGLNSSFGEFSGYVPVYLHAPWIQSVLVPEPGTYALMGLGLAVVAAAARRRRLP